MITWWVDFSSFFQGALERTLSEVEWRPFGSGAPIIPAELGGWAGAWGAAAEALVAAGR